jgi:hypothetical protein
MLGNSANLRVGRLLEVRADAGYRTAAEVEAIFVAIGRELRKLTPGTSHVAVVDWRRCPVMSPEAADAMLRHISRTNADTFRSAALAREGAPVAVLQFVRLIRDANMLERKLFLDGEELYAWLAEVLTPAERARLRQFLNERDSPR